MTNVNQLREKLQDWHGRLLRLYGKKHPLTMLARVSMDSGNRTIMEETLETLASDQSPGNELCGPARESPPGGEYASCKPKAFRQFDGWYVEDIPDHIMRPDYEGHVVIWSDILHRPDIRVLVNENTSREQIIPLIHKLAKSITDEYSQPTRKDWPETFPF